jgi:glycosyltransferase involved in cell wall biosynthesis/SAM-dependent methyltransferase
MPSGEIPVLIPSYKPGEKLVELVADLLELGVQAIIIVDDGSGPEFESCFQSTAAFAQVHVIHHAVNLGKGAALKTGMNHALVNFPDCLGVVTADADGQHHPDDIVRVSERLRENRSALTIGVRTFDSRVPWKSRIGNTFTRGLMHWVVGQKLSDTQTGLRGIPASLIPHLLRVSSSGYEFELDMLMACKHQGCPLIQVPIQTIYVDDNRGSHFHPITDSMKIYFLLLRFSALSLATAVIDNVVFAFTYSATGSIGISQIAGRFLAMIFNYLGARSVVFHSQQKHTIVFPKYVFLVVCNGLVSYILIQFLHFRMGFATIPSKLVAEGLLFIANFAIQRDFVFTRARRETANQATDWDRDNTNVPLMAIPAGRDSTAAPPATGSFLTHPLLRGIRIGTPEWFAAQRAMIRVKPAVQRCYDRWYRELLDDADSVPESARSGLIVELGSGSSGLKALRSEIISSDIEPGVGDMVIDGRRLPFPDATVRAVLLTHVFHHIPDVRLFLREAARVLMPGGVISMVDCTHTPFARFFFSRIHPEPYDARTRDWSFPEGHSMLDSNQALTWIVFCRDREQCRNEFPQLRLERMAYLPWLGYLLSGGVNLRSLVPRLAAPLVAAADVLARPLDPLFAIHWHIRIRKVEGRLAR